MRCVVCGGPLPPGEPRYANAWERVRKKLPCCSETCVAGFDEDQHWIPPVRPPIAPPSEQPRLRQLVTQRLAAGDHARPVARELLAAGIDPETLRGLIGQGQAAAEAAVKSRRKRTLFSAVMMVVTRHSVHLPGGPQEANPLVGYAESLADIDAWIAAGAAPQPGRP